MPSLADMLQALMSSQQGVGARGLMDVSKGGTSSYPKNEIDRQSIVNTIMQGMDRPPRAQGDLPQGQPVMLAGDVVPFQNPLGQSANRLQPETLAKLRAYAAQMGIDMDTLRYMIAQQMQQQGK